MREAGITTMQSEQRSLFHPECHKDKDNGMDASNVDTSMEENSSPVKKEMEVEEEKEDVHKASNDETTNELASPAPTEESVIKTEPPAEQTNDDLNVPMEEVSVQDNEATVAVKEEHEKEETDGLLLSNQTMTSTFLWRKSQPRITRLQWL